MNEKYDLGTDETASWSPEAIAANQRAQDGLFDADLQPLLDYIRSGFVIDHNLAAQIGMAIEKVGPSYITAHRATLGNQPYSKITAIYARNLEIGHFIERRLRENQSLKYKDAVEDAAAEFGIGITAAKSALRDLRRQLRGDFSGFPHVDLVKLQQMFPNIASERSQPTRRVRPK